MAGTIKNLVIGAVIGAGASTGVIMPLTGDQYAEGAAKVEMAAQKIPETIEQNSETGKLDTIPERLSLPSVKVNSGANGEPIVLVPGKKYRMVVEMDGKILAESEYTPDEKLYPTDGDSLVGVFKFAVVKDRI